VGPENIFLFGLTADEVASSSPWYSPYWHYDHEPETRAAIDLLFSDHINSGAPDLYEPIRQSLLAHGDHYMHLADLRSYVQTQERIGALYRQDPSGWTARAIVNVAGSGRFSADRTISEYAREIWHAKPCPVP
ncbi:MAG: glycogen/starch/alpha-glucan phosphorylase, partial [Isosphaeraceae bacterium]